MKICIYGAGAIGGYLGAKLAEAGVDVSLIARGPHLAAMQKDGLRLNMNGEQIVTRPTCTSDPTELGPQDFIIVTLKAHSVAGVVPAMQPLLGADTAVVTAVNGVPWWYFHQLPSDWQDQRVASVDPGNVQWDGIGPERAIGCVVYPACEISAPGVIEHIEGNRFTLGEPSGEKTERVLALSKTLISAGFKAPVRPAIRDEIWIKLWGNLCFNPLSALTHATLDVIATEDGTRNIARAMMLEAQAIGEKLGVRFPIDVDKRIAGAAGVGAHKTSMLQDLELQRPMEIDALVTAVQELGKLVALPTPTIDLVLALIQQRARVAGCY
ncbi:MAG: 2-dehydropantoate 2-reductase [Alphaproteobacteria bacterium]|jgi:2-dehydropantoate 2-reductase|nr:2-dehydropantoate 2-reductase [Alphaproteobacteria bacterium]MBT4085272.1 2-dehydropantoate 2-reductase [Alphaproteobacteria bacterium]MBT4544201.1 2-dehydropantoate 2-reductase [Alphaproteobacteria bacterium]MBT7747427.1 2-dehydropantoate 2-reductase [Alphaproteobacteria bacterium]